MTTSDAEDRTIPPPVGEGATEETDPRLGRLPGLGCLWAGIGGIGLALTAFLVVGLVLPGTWEVERTRTFEASPEALYDRLADLAEWEVWTHWPPLSSLEASGDTGIGASRSWDDPNYGAGTLTLSDLEPNRQVEYTVTVDGSIHVFGRLTLTEAGPSRTHLSWRETGDFGRNPLLAYTALGMDRLQGQEMEKSFDRLARLVNPNAAFSDDPAGPR